jgi:hypothetical protein
MNLNQREKEIVEKLFDDEIEKQENFYRELRAAGARDLQKYYDKADELTRLKMKITGAPLLRQISEGGI